ncbi:MAG: lipopolysaccharide kinase InaA family protein [Zoogloeaceae bacterium]|jgi:tRNA A-37 threonylcarbamoyl transferase component Bud32|nr:lipopolysaccharide kinase InaA family protein [Zoogloeaceae bacterium]
MSAWRLEPAYLHLAAAFGSLDRVFALEGEALTRSSRSEVLRVTLAGTRYYVKRYQRSMARDGRSNWRRALRYALLACLPRTRVRSEWQNLMRFAQWGIPTAEIVAFGEERRFGMFSRGALITRELENTQDLAELARRKDPRLRDRAWVRQVGDQIAACTRILHAHRFAHNDLKWRNILVDDSARVYLIDCPLGSILPAGPLLRRRMEKDLATLDKVACTCLSRSTRLRFFLVYREKQRLAPPDKASIRRITHFFKDRP